MSFREKSAIVTLIVLVVVYGGYFARALTWAPDTPVEAIDGALIRTVIGLVVLLVFVHVVLGVLTTMAGEKAAEDERDRMFELIGDRNGGYVVGFGAVGAMLMLLAQLPPAQVIHILLGALVLSEIVKIGTQLVLYRRGVQ